MWMGTRAAVLCGVAVSVAWGSVVSIVEHASGQVLALRSGDRSAERLAVLAAVSP